MGSPKIAQKIELCQQSINKWVDRFVTEGIEGLENRPGQGAKPTISKEVDEETIRKAIEEDRQSVKAAKAAGGILGQKDLGGDVQTFFYQHWCKI